MITNRRRATIAAVVGLASLFLCGSTFAGDDKKDGKKKDNYGLIYGTAYGPDDHPMYGVRVTIHPAGRKRPIWEQLSDHHGEFAQRVPPGPGDYEVSGVIEVIPVEDGKPQKSKKKRLKGEAKVHIDDQERKDFSLHLTE
jgi:hypothetical protein